MKMVNFAVLSELIFIGIDIYSVQSMIFRLLADGFGFDEEKGHHLSLLF